MGSSNGVLSSFDSHELAGDNAITALAFSAATGEGLIAGGCGDSVTLWSGDGSLDVVESLIVRRNLPVTCLQFTASAKNLIVSSSDPNIMVYTLDSHEEMTLLNSQAIGVRSFALSPQETRIAVVNENGDVSIHSLAVESRGTSEAVRVSKCLSVSMNLVSTSIVRDANNIGFGVQWLDERSLIVPSVSGSLAVLKDHNSSSQKQWTESLLIGDATQGLQHNTSAEVNLVTLSPNKHFLASADVSGRIVVWKLNVGDWSRSKAIRSFDCESFPLIDLRWMCDSDDSNALLVLTGAAWKVIPDVVPTTEGTPVAVMAVSATESAVVMPNDIEGISDEQLLAMMNDVEAASASQAMEAVSSQTLSALKSSDSVVTNSPAKVNDNKKLKKTSTKRDHADNEDADIDFGDDSRPAATTTASGVTASKVTSAKALFGDDDDSGDEDRRGGDNDNGDYGDHDEDKDDDALDDDFDDFEGDDEALTMEQLTAMVRSLRKAQKTIQERQRREDQHGGGKLDTLAQRLSHPSFQPSSTRNDERQRRYLCWNHIGNITLREDSMENRVEIRFSDTSVHRNEAFADRSGFVIGTLGECGAAFATEADEVPVFQSLHLGRGGHSVLSQAELEEEEELKRVHQQQQSSARGATIQYHAFHSAQRMLKNMNESFRITLARGEAVLALAVGRGFIAAATSQQLLRVFSSTGLEVSVTALKGAVVCVAALDRRLAVVYHRSFTSSSSGSSSSVLLSQLAVDIYEFDADLGCRSGRAVLTDMPLPMCTQSQRSLSLNTPATSQSATQGSSKTDNATQQIEWLGFHVEQQTLAMLDSSGMLWSLVFGLDWQWVPVLSVPEVRKTIDHKFWPISIKHHKLVYVLLNGESRPAVFPQPVVSTRVLKIPIVSIRDGSELPEATRDRLHQALYDDVCISHEENRLWSIQHEAALAASSSSSGILPLSHVDEMAQLEARIAEDRMAMDKMLVKCFQDACAAQLTSRAMNFALRLRDVNSLAKAIQVANHLGRTSIAQQLDELMQQRVAMEESLQSSANAFGGADGDEYTGYGDNDNDDYDRRYRNGSAESEGGALSRKASLRQSNSRDGLPSEDSNTASAINKQQQKKATNPFALSQTSTPSKRPASDDKKSSPSPKKPALVRTSTFAQQARQHRQNDKSIL